MTKAAEAFRTIGEVADSLDVPKHVLRFWEGKFPQIRPMKRGGGRRYYRPEDMELLRGIQHLLHAEGYTIKGVQKILREHGVDQVKTAAAQAMARLAEDEQTGTKKRGRKRVTAAGNVLASGGKALSSDAEIVRKCIEELEACRNVLLAVARQDSGRAPVRAAKRARSRP